MIREAIATASTIDEAIEKAKNELGIGENDECEHEVLEMPVKKTLGLFGGKPAKVRVFIETPDPKPEKPAKPAKPAKTAPAKPVKAAQPAAKSEKPVPTEEPISKTGKLAEPDEVSAFVKELIEKMGITNVTVTKYEIEGGARYDIDGDDAGSIIGRRGETLDAIQYLACLSVNRKDGEYTRIVLNVGNYREKREITLNNLAAKIARNALRSGRNTTLEPMSPYERRIIHTAIQDIDGVSSWSVGEEPNRCVVIGSDKKRSDRRRPQRGGRNDRRDRNYNKPQDPVSTREPKTLDETDIPLYGRIDVKKD